MSKTQRLLLASGALGVAVVLAPMFAAFEAHVVNVTARIENALSVSTDAIDFGTVFPQEHLDQPLRVALSGSFMDEDRVDDVNYFIRQKPKCGLTSLDGQTLLGPTATGHVSVNPDTGEVTIDCGPAPEEFEAEVNVWGVLPSLCEYISKEGDETGEEGNDGTTPSFHEPWTVNDAGQVVWLDTPGRLAKSEQDTEDNWTIDLAVPCFGDHCAQDWADFVHGINPDANPDNYTQDIADEHKVFGCNLWIEVSGVSESTTPPPPPPPTIGADLTAYNQPTGECDATVLEGNSIQSAIDTANPGDTICVGPGAFTEDVNVNKSLTLSGDGADNTTILNGVGLGEAGALVISANDVTVEGFVVNGTGVSAIRISGARDNVVVRSNRAVAASGKNAFLTDGGQSNHTISNNVFEGAASQLVYVNGNASVATPSTNVDFLDNTFGGTATGPLLGMEANGSLVSHNVFSGVTSYAGIEAWEADLLVNENNFNADEAVGPVHVKNAAGGTLNAENNWWGDTDPSDNVDGTVDADPSSAVAFPQN